MYIILKISHVLSVGIDKLPRLHGVVGQVSRPNISFWILSLNFLLWDVRDLVSL